MTDRLIVCSDLNCPGADSSSVDPGLAAVIDAFGLMQHVCSPTRNNNLLDVFASDSSVSVSDVCIDDASLISDRRLVAAKLSALVLAGQGASKTSTRRNSSAYCGSPCSRQHRRPSTHSLIRSKRTSTSAFSSMRRHSNLRLFNNCRCNCTFNPSFLLFVCST